MFKQKTAYELLRSLVGSEMCIRDRFYQPLAGVLGLDTQIVEREWESMAAMEASWEKLLSTPEYAELASGQAGVVVNNRWELYIIL